MKEQVNDLFVFEGEDSMLVIPVVIAFKHNGNLMMSKGYSKKASQWYPALPKELGWWHRKYSSEPLISYKHNVISFPIKLTNKEMVTEKFLESSFMKLRSVIQAVLYGFPNIYVPLHDPLYESVDALKIGREILHDLTNVIIVREIQL